MITIAICENETIFIDKIHKMTSDILGSAHIPFLCSCFSSGEEFLQSLAAGSQYDIVLLDIGLNGTNGLEVANQFRNLLHLKKMILIYISSYEERAKEAFPLHTHRFLSKPIDKGCFKEALISAIARHWAKMHQKTAVKYNGSFEYNAVDNDGESFFIAEVRLYPDKD